MIATVKDAAWPHDYTEELDSMHYEHAYTSAAESPAADAWCLTPSACPRVLASDLDSSGPCLLMAPVHDDRIAWSAGNILKPGLGSPCCCA